MTDYRNDAARTGLADGTLVTNANSGGGTNTAFSAVAGGVTVSTANPNTHTTMSYHVPAQTGTQGYVHLPIGTATANNALRFYVHVDATSPIPTTAQTLAQLGGTGQNVIGVNASGHFIVTLQGSNAYTSTYTIAGGSLYRVEAWWTIAASGADFHFAAYIGDSGTAVASFDTTTANTGTTNPTMIGLGKKTTSGNWSDLYISSIRANNVGGAFIGVPAANSAPTANAGADFSASSGALVTLDGSGSSDPDGDPLTYAWTQTGGTGVSLAGSNTVNPQFTAGATGTLTFSLVVTDNLGSSSTADTVTVTVGAAQASNLSVPNGPSDVTTGHTGSATSLTVGKPANTADGDVLCALVFERNTGATLTATGWTAISGATTNVTIGTAQAYYKKIPTASSEPSTYSFSWTGGSPRASVIICRIVGTDSTTPLDAVGTYTIATGSASSITLAAATAVAARTAEIAWVIANRTDLTYPDLTPPDGTWSIIAEDTFDNGTASTNAFLAAKIKTGAGSTGTAVISMNPGSVGGAGGVLITFAGAAAAIANAGPDQSNIEPYATVTLDGTGSSARSGHTNTYAWTQVDGPTVTLSSSTAASPTFTAPATVDGDTVSFQLVVNDGGSDSLPDVVTIGILPHTIWRLDASGPSPVRMSAL